MKPSIKKKTIKTAIGLFMAISLLICSGIKLPVLDAKTDSYFRDAITKAGVAYATCRIVNASVSIVKESDLQLEPAGIGVSLALGQALDPIDDMTERLSDVLVTAMTSLGVQKLAYEICVSMALPILSIFLIVLSMLIWFDNETISRLKITTLKILFIIVIARICLPMSSLTNAFIYEHFFAEKILAANNELSLGTAELDKLKDFSLPQIDGVLGTIENSASFLKRKSVAFNNAIVYAVSHMGAIVENLLKLTFLYVAIFLIQVIALPLFIFWILAKAANSLFQTNIPVILNQSAQNQIG